MLKVTSNTDSLACYTQSKQILYVWVIIIQLCFEITRGGVLNGELYAQRFQKLILFCFSNGDDIGTRLACRRHFVSNLA